MTTESDVWKILETHHWPGERDVHARLETGVTPLLYALQRDLPLSTIQTLVDMGSDVFAKDNSGMSVFQQALLRRGDATLPILRLLLDHGVDLLEEIDIAIFERGSKVGENRVFLNTQRFSMALTRIPALSLLLLEKSLENPEKIPLDLNARLPLGETFLVKALKSERVPFNLCALLIEKSPSTQSALQALLFNPFAWNEDERAVLAQKILERGHFVDEKDTEGFTSLRRCIKRRNLPGENTSRILKLFLEAGADPNEKSPPQKEQSSSPITDADLLSYGPLVAAFLLRRPDQVSLLLQYGADIHELQNPLFQRYIENIEKKYPEDYAHLQKIVLEYTLPEESYSKVTPRL